MYSDLLNLIQTTDDLNIFKEELQLLRKSLFDSKNNFDTVLNSKVRRNVSNVIAKVLSDTKQDSKTFLDNIESELEKVKVVKLTIAFEPNNQSFAAIYQWFEDNMGVNIVLDLYNNPNILGGVQVSFEGKYYDGALVSKVNEVIKIRHAEFSSASVEIKGKILKQVQDDRAA